MASKDSYIIQRLDKWIHESYPLTPEQLGIARILFAGAHLIFGGMFHIDWIAQFPQVFYNPVPGLGLLFDDFLPISVYHFLNVAHVFTMFMVLVGYKTRFFTVAASIVLFLYFTAIFSFGNIYHAGLVPFALLVMSFSNWGAAYSIDSKTQDEEPEIFTWPITLLMILIGFAYFTAGISKLTGGWLDVQFNATRHYFMYEYLVTERQQFLAPFFYQLKSDLIWEVLDWSTVFMEVGILFSIIRAGWFRVFVFFVICFHVTVFLSLNICFSALFIIFTPFIKYDAPFFQTRFWQTIELGIKSAFEKLTMPWVLCAFGIYILIFYSRGYEGRLEIASFEQLISLFLTPILILAVWIYNLLNRKKAKV